MIGIKYSPREKYMSYKSNKPAIKEIIILGTTPLFLDRSKNSLNDNTNIAAINIRKGHFPKYTQYKTIGAPTIVTRTRDLSCANANLIFLFIGFQLIP